MTAATWPSRMARSNGHSSYSLNSRSGTWVGAVLMPAFVGAVRSEMLRRREDVTWRQRQGRAPGSRESPPARSRETRCGSSP